MSKKFISVLILVVLIFSLSITMSSAQKSKSCKGLKNALDSMGPNAQGRSKVLRQYLAHGCDSVVTEPPVTEPTATEPTATEPTATEPTATEPTATEPTATEPTATEPTATEPTATEPTATEPTATEPTATEPTATEPTATEPTATEPTATEPTATEPTATEPTATEPTATEPTATEPTASPSPTEPPTQSCEVDEVIPGAYYVSLTGDDNNPGTAEEPFLTFLHATSVLQPGDLLLICGGVYDEMLDVREQINGSPEAYITIEPVAGHEVIIDVDYAISRDILIRGNYINVSGMEVRNSENSCIDVQGDYVNVDNMVVHHCNQHGVIFRGQYGTLQNSEVYAASWANTNNPEDLNHQSGIKVAEGENITISNNLIHENYGEGMSLRGKTIHVSGNVVYDNYAVNVYIDNGSDVTIDGNYIYGTENPVFYVEGRRQSCISVAEEYYEGWGSNLINLVVTNNIVVGCRVSFNYWGYVEGVEMPGLKGALIAHNIFWGSSDRAMRIVERPFNENIRVYNNVVQNSDNRFARFEGLTTGITADYNFWVDLIEGDGNAVIGANGPNDLSGDVGFLTPPTLSGDPNNITLAPDSPVIDAGTNLAGVSNDYFGTTRDSAPDMGAIEAP